MAVPNIWLVMVKNVRQTFSAISLPLDAITYEALLSIRRDQFSFRPKWSNFFG